MEMRRPGTQRWSIRCLQGLSGWPITNYLTDFSNSWITQITHYNCQPWLSAGIRVVIKHLARMSRTRPGVSGDVLGSAVLTVNPEASVAYQESVLCGHVLWGQLRTWAPLLCLRWLRLDHCWSHCRGKDSFGESHASNSIFCPQVTRVISTHTNWPELVTWPTQLQGGRKFRHVPG